MSAVGGNKLHLIIIGNGFDIAHGINSRYSDFYAYLESYEIVPKPLFPEFPKFLDINSISSEDTKKHALLEDLEKYIPSEDLWSCFEESLGNLDYEQLKEDNSNYLLNPGDDKWRDSANHDYQYMIQEELKFTNDIDYQFKRWISGLNTKVQPLQSIINILNNCMTPTLFLNFNYTDTLEKIYGINRQCILYIHGKVGDNEKLVLGHHDNSFWNSQTEDTSTMTEEEYDAYCEYMQERDFREIEADDVIKSFFKTTYKDTTKIIEWYKAFFIQLRTCSKVFVLGHSLSDVDSEYFYEIRKNILPNCEWIISAYSSDDKKRALQFVQSLQIQKYQIITI